MRVIIAAARTGCHINPGLAIANKIKQEEKDSEIMFIGTTEGFERKLEVNGVGYRAAKAGNNLNLTLGYSHPVVVEAPEGISFEVQQNIIIVKGMDKELVGQTAAVIRTKRPPEVYRGKGIKYAEETIRRKEGKAGKK